MGLVLDEYGVCVDSVLYVCGKGPGRMAFGWSATVVSLLATTS